MIPQVMVEKALWIALNAHAGLMDKSGEPYILHPMRVAGAFVGEEYRLHQIVALLHDVVEDTPVSLDELEDFGPEVVAAIDAISDREGEVHKDYIKRVGQNKLATEVKLADLRDNSQHRRIKDLSIEQAESLGKRYAWAIHYLMNRKDFGYAE